MVILTDCLAEKLDEGCIKVANQLTMRIKQSAPETLVVSYREKTEKSDIHLNLNKLFLNGSLIRLLRKTRDPILYIPFSSNTTASVLRTFLLSLYAPGRVNVLYALQHPMNALVKLLLKCSRARVVTLAQSARNYYRKNGNETVYIKAGVDTRKFCPVLEERKQQLREKYQIPEGKRVVLHVGHLNSGRNVQVLGQLPNDCIALLVCSPRGKQDHQIRSALLEHPNIRILDSFLEDIEEVYQLADVYLFPVLAQEHCIDAPLSVLEAAACNLPVIATVYGELAALCEERGFRFITECSPETLDGAVDAMFQMKNCQNRLVAEAYDWDLAVSALRKALN